MSLDNIGLTRPTPEEIPLKEVGDIFRATEFELLRTKLGVNDANFVLVKDAIDAIVGGVPGADGADGREIQLTNTGTHIAWRYVGDLAYTNLISIAEITGADGSEVQIRNTGTDIEWKLISDVTWNNIISVAAITGREIELGTNDTHIRWRYVGTVDWTNLIALSLLKGEDGAGIEIAGNVATYAALPVGLGALDAGKGYLVEADGLLYIWDGTAFPTDGNGIAFRGPDGREVELQKTVTHVQWRYVGDAEWINLIPLTDITGPTGATGATGTTGDSAYVYIAYASDNTGTGFTLTFNPALDYIAILTTDIEIVTPLVADFAGLWKNYKGATGDTGATGATGATGSAGADGADGFSVLNGNIDPTTEGVNGDFYINTANWTIFGPKTLGAWGTGTSMIGADGLDGSPDTAAQIVTKLESIAVEAEKLSHTAIKNFDPEVATVIATEVSEPDLDQFIELNGRYTLATDKVYTSGTTMLFDVARQYGMNSDTLNAEHNVPRYYFLGISRTGARDGNQSAIYHSSLVSPEILTPNKPTSPLPVYADQAAMLADQASQVADEYYEYTGSTSMWLYNGLANGLITDYTELTEVAGWEEWGTKPEWLIVTGDAYLEGLDNLNKMTGTFYRRYDSGGTTLFDVVILNIEAFTGGNIDANRNNASKLIIHNYNENESPVVIDSIENTSIYGGVFPTEIIRPDQSSYILLSGSNYAFSIGNLGSNDSSVRAIRNVMMPNGWERFFDTQQVSIIWKGELNNTGSAVVRGLFGNYDNLNFLGFGFGVNNTFGLRLSVTSGIALNSYNSTSSIVTEDSGQWTLGVTFEKISPSSLQIKFYRQSPVNAVAFELISTVNGTLDAILNTGSNVFELDRHGGTGTMRGTINDHLVVINRTLTEAEMQAEFTELNPA